LRGKTFKEIDGTLWSRRINNTQISANVIDPQTPVGVKFDIFKRINTGGSPLNAQEIRHCMTRSRSRNFLMELSDSPAFPDPPALEIGREIKLRIVDDIKDLANRIDLWVNANEFRVIWAYNVGFLRFRIILNAGADLVIDLLTSNGFVRRHNGDLL
jgi:hypothetical protein